MAEKEDHSRNRSVLHHVSGKLCYLSLCYAWKETDQADVLDSRAATLPIG